MLSTIHQFINKIGQHSIVVCTAFALTGCETSDSSLIDLETLFPQDVITNTLSDNQLDEIPSDNQLDETPSDDQLDEIPSDQTVTDTDNTGTANLPEAGTGTNINTITAPTEVLENQIPLELALLTEGEIFTESRFGGTSEPIPDSFSLSISDYEVSPDGEFSALRSESGDIITVCSYISLTAQYLCLRLFDLDLNDRVWQLFSLQSRFSGSGVFEFCTIEINESDCLDKLIENPDGTSVVTIGNTNATGLLPDSSPYFSYENQANVTTRSSQIFIDQHYINTMNYIMDSLVLKGQ